MNDVSENMNQGYTDDLQRSATVLVVDDVADNLSLISKVLQARYTVKVATKGEVALRLARATPHPDLILLDIVMPGMDGYEVCQRLREDPATRSIPVIFLTAQSSDEEKGLEVGAVDFISKLLTPTEI